MISPDLGSLAESVLKGGFNPASMIAVLLITLDLVVFLMLLLVSVVEILVKQSK